VSSLYVKLDVNYDDDPAIIEAGEKAELLFVRGLVLAKRTLSDGFIADAQLPRTGLSGVAARAKRLVEVGLWVRDEDRGGYWIRSWSKRNPSKADVEQLVETRRENGRKGGLASGAARRSKQGASPDPNQLASDDAKQGAAATPEQPANPEQSRAETEQSKTPLGAAVPATQDSDGAPPGQKRPRDEIWDTMLEVCGLTGQEPTSSARGAWNRAAAELRGLKVTPDEIRTTAAAYRRQWPNVSLTPTALSRRWAEAQALTPPPDPVRRPEYFDLDAHYASTEGVAS